MTESTFAIRPRAQMMLAGDTLLLRLRDRTYRMSPFDDVAERVIKQLWSGTTRSALCATVADADQRRAAIWFDDLVDAGLMTATPSSTDVEPADRARFDRLIRFLSEYETPDTDRYELFSRLRGAKVGIVGTGGTGSWVVYQLLCFGVGTIRLIDGDVVDASNLNRSILYNETDIGTPKVVAAAQAIHRFAPRTQVQMHDLFVDSAEGLAPYVEGLDLLIGTADKPPWLIREWVARACHAVNVPFLQATGVAVGPLCVPGESSCTMCEWAHIVQRNPRFPALLEAQRRLPDIDPCGIATVGSIAAGVIASDVFAHLVGGAPATTGRIWSLNPDHTASFRDLPRHPACPVCGDPA